jgi:hypothetical protein
MALTKIPASLLDTSSGFDLQGNITLGDSEKIRLGAGPDLDIYHDGSNSYIEDLGDGALFVKASGGIYFNGKTTDEPLARFLENGAVNLYYDNDLRIATSSAGATVDGTLTVTGNLDITGDINSYNVTDLDVTDQTITLGAGQTEANSGGSGIIIDGSNASILWDETNTEFDINNSINVTGGLNLSGDIYGTGHFDIRSTGNIFNTYGNSSNVYFRTQNGTDRVVIDSSGIVHIGSGTAINDTNVKLQLNAPSSGEAGLGINDNGAYALLLQYTSGTGARIRNIKNTPIFFETNNAERMRIDSSGHVGIGMTPAPVGSDTVLSLYNSATPRIKLHNSTTGTTSGDGAEINMSSSDFILENREAGNVRFFNNGSERMRIDSSGTLLIGTTNGSGAGLEISKIHGVRSTVTNNVAALFDRLSSDGDIALFRKDGSTVGSIGANSNDMYIASIGTYSCGLMFEGSSGARDIRPCSSTGALLDGSVDLGDSTAKFNDIYLDGGVHLGGTGSANKLDDYEEGTWTPDLRNGTTSLSTQTWHYGPTAVYTKIGDLVFIHLSGKLSAVGGTSSGELRIFGLPFSGKPSGGYQEYRMNFFLGNQPTAADSYQGFAFVRNNGTDFGTRLLQGGDNIFTSNRLDNDTFFTIFGCYKTNS